LVASLLYAAMVTLQSFILAGLTSHILVILGGIGVTTAVAISAASFQGMGQFVARFGQIFFNRGSHPLSVAVLSGALYASSFVVAIAGRGFPATAYGFTLLFGAANGLMTIAKGTLPLLMFSREAYGANVGRLIAPGFFLSAAAPTIYAELDARLPGSAFVVSAGLAATIFAVTLALYARLRRRTPGA
jgi:hypothetical protein